MLLPIYDSWENLNETLSEQLNLSPEQGSVRVMKSLGVATWETIQGTAQFYSHKRSAVVITGSSPHVQQVLPFLYKEGFQVQTISWPEDVPSFVQSLAADTSFVLYCEDHPVTGEVFDYLNLDKALNERKIFSIRLSYQNHFREFEKINNYTVRICGIDAETTLGFVGSRFKANSPVANLEYWDHKSVIESVKKSKLEFIQNEQAILRFESHLPKEFSCYQFKGPRLFDRTLIYNQLVSGQTVQTHLSNYLNMNISELSWEKNIETTHLCRWGGIATYQGWWQPTPSEEVLRNLVILSVGIIQKENLNELLLRAVSDGQFQIEIS